jgi:formyltetrahydrofolate-dependent phosphoribosylglycinamide formyltransferase
MAKKVRLGVLVSGGGTTLQNFIDKIAEGALNAEIVVVISSRPGVYALERAGNAGIPAEVVNRNDYDSVEAFSEAITAVLDKYGVELATLAGFLSLYRIPDFYLGHVLNIHPALLPGHGGKGYYGDRVHSVVLESGDRESGCTVHFADNVYDHGPIAVQKRVPVLPGDTVETLKKRVFEQECIAYPEAINLFALGKLDALAAKLRKT